MIHGIFLDQGLNLWHLHCRWILNHWTTREALCINFISWNYQTHWWGPVVIWWNLQDFLCIVTCYLQTVTVLLLFFQFVFRLFLFLLWLLEPLNKSGESGHLCLVPDLRENAFISVFHHWEWCLLWDCHIWSLLCWGKFPLWPFSGVFNHTAKLLSRDQFFVTPWTIAYQASLSMGFSRQEYWSGLPFILQEIFPTQGLKMGLPHC